MKKLLALGAASLIFAGCSTNTATVPNPSPDTTTVDTTQTTPTDTTATEMTPAASASPVAMMKGETMPDGSMKVTLDTQNDLGQSGTATLTPSVDGKSVTVALNLTGGTFTGPQPAHIHEGSCPTPGAVKFPLTNVVAGKSTTVLKMSMADLLKAAPQLSINVHKSAAESSVYTACGNIQ